MPTSLRTQVTVSAVMRQEYIPLVSRQRYYVCPFLRICLTTQAPWVFSCEALCYNCASALRAILCPGDIWQCLETCLDVTLGNRLPHLAGRGQECH